MTKRRSSGESAEADGHFASARMPLVEATDGQPLA
jgi:hypothetical protein